jgi:mRNA interferase MazF
MKNRSGMSHFQKGDMIIGSVSFEERSGPKVRPCIVVAAGDNNVLFVCPVSSRPSYDECSVPLSILDFYTGGLDMFEESYVLPSRVLKIKSGDVLGKRGRLSDQCILRIIKEIPAGYL